MHRNLHSPTKLTEFARDFEIEPETFLTKFMNSITNVYNTSYNSINVVPPNNVTIPPESLYLVQSKPDQLSPSSINQNIFARVSSESDFQTFSDEITNDDNINSNYEELSSITVVTTTPKVVSEFIPSNVIDGRTPQNVIQRIINLVNLGSYKNTELQKFWMPDSKSKECYECSMKFSTFRRKHHCRLCGQIFCAKCCNQVVPGKIINCSGDLKVCTYCSKIVLTYLKSSDINSDLKSDLKALQDDLTNKLNTANNSSELTSVQSLRNISVGYQEERLISNSKNNILNEYNMKTIFQHSQSLKALHSEMINCLPNAVQQIRGYELLVFLIQNLKSSNTIQAIAILNAMIEAEYIIPLYVLNDVGDKPGIQQHFDDNFFYKIISIDNVMSSSGSFQLDLNIDTNSAHLSRSKQDVDNDVILPTSQDSWFGFSTSKEFELQNSLLSTAASKPLLEAFCDHEDLLLTQLLRNENLDQFWSKILLPICARVANSIRPELCSLDLMDIRKFVNFKKVASGHRTETKIIGGIVFSKNVVHKDMAKTFENPRILLINSAIVYQRVEGKFVSLETLMLQEREYLRNVIARILSFKPNVVLVHKNVSGIAQDMLRDHGITLVLDVKLSVLERLSRCLKCDILTSIDSNIGQPKLGFCDRFDIRTFDNVQSITGTMKTLMVFEISSSQRGCCVLLRGGSISELIKVKKVAQLLLFARYNWRLELSFLLDELARPPSPKPNIFDSKDHSPLKAASNVSDDEEIELIDHSDETIRKNYMKIKKSSIAAVKFFENRKFDDKCLNKQNVQDFSDPLRAPDNQSFHPEEQSSVEFAVEMPYDNRFRTALYSTILSISPLVAFPLPFLETEQGRKCILRAYYPHELYYSQQWSKITMEKMPLHDNGAENQISVKNKIPFHTFINHKITTSIENKEIQTLLAGFRASGGKLIKTGSMKKISKIKSTFVTDQPGKIDNENVHSKDALDLVNHQRLSVLFCSYYYNSKAPSSFCTQPSLLNMIFYGQNDIMLGQFLEYYCFRSSYICQSCNLPMLNHVRRYVHSMGCIQVKLTEDLTIQNMDKILMTSWCSVCHEMTPSVPMSKDTWCLSFAKYLELRFHSHVYKRRIVNMSPEGTTNELQPCTSKQHDDNSNNNSGNGDQKSQVCSHSLHRDHVQYFSFNGIVATLTYTLIEVWEISLPSPILTLKNPRLIDVNIILEDIKQFALKGHEVFAKIREKLIELDAVDLVDHNSMVMLNLKTMLNQHLSMFREKVTTVQTLLTERTVNALEITDAMILVKRILAESIELWSSRLCEVTIRSNNCGPKAEFSSNIGGSNGNREFVDSAVICTEELKTDIEFRADPKNLDYCVLKGQRIPHPGPAISVDTLEKIQLFEDQQNIQASHIVNKTIIIDSFPPRIESSDKKSVKQILRELLASDKNTFHLQSPMPITEHYCLPLGCFPIVVCDQDLSSVIAYTLISNDYRKALYNTQLADCVNDNILTAMSIGTNSPKLKRKAQETTQSDGDEKDSSKESEKKTSKSGHHIEITFQDLTTHFTCKIYFAREFDTMRNNFLRPPPTATLVKLDRFNLNLGGGQKNNNSFATGTQHHQYSEDIQNAFGRSLSESMKWEARGGKSGSKFCKTLDDRFVLKEMTKQDVAKFENFAPNYFLYVNQCLEANQPTLLVKIFGVFKVTIKNKDLTCEKSLLIMENLFYNCDISNKFDLKGSDRNRLVDPTNQHGEIVLLDENLIQMSWSKPLYVLSHSKTILRDAIARDASFLEKNDVMDYSLLVGLNTNQRLLVLGIIDYIRTFTFEKRIESIVKQTGILGGQGKLPTVVSPKLYKQRFSEAMERYFLTVPDRWEGLAKK